MPTVLFINGWRFFFYANEGNEPIHVHCKKAEKRCKFWLDEDAFDIEEEHSYKMSPADKRFVKKVLFQNFDYIVQQWYEFKDGEP